MPITRAGGRLRLGGDGEVVEWLVHLRRFDETMTLDHVAERGGLTPELIGKVAARVLATYAEAERRDGRAATEALGAVIEETLAELGERAGSVSRRRRPPSPTRCGGCSAEREAAPACPW